MVLFRETRWICGRGPGPSRKPLASLAGSALLDWLLLIHGTEAEGRKGQGQAGGHGGQTRSCHVTYRDLFCLRGAGVDVACA